MKKYLFLTLLFLVFLPTIVKGYCDDSEVVRLQKLAKNVNASYIYDDASQKFSITLLNLKKDLIIKDLINNKSYNIDGEFTFHNLNSGKHTYVIYANNKECTTYSLSTINVEIPYFNVYSTYEECKGIENYSYCSRWVKNVIPNDIWKTKVELYRKSIEIKEVQKKNEKSLLQSIIDIYLNYYYIMLPSTILIIIIVIIVENRKNRLV